MQKVEYQTCNELGLNPQCFYHIVPDDCVIEEVRAPTLWVNVETVPPDEEWRYVLGDAWDDAGRILGEHELPGLFCS